MTDLDDILKEQKEQTKLLKVLISITSEIKFELINSRVRAKDGIRDPDAGPTFTIPTENK